MALGAAPAGSGGGVDHHRIALRQLLHALSSTRPNLFLPPPSLGPPSLWQLRRANFRVYDNTHLCGTTTAKAPSSTSGTALGSACSSQRLQTVALMAFRDRLTAGQAAVSTWNMASGNPVREARPPLTRRAPPHPPSREDLRGLYFRVKGI